MIIVNKAIYRQKLFKGGIIVSAQPKHASLPCKLVCVQKAAQE